MKAFEVYVNAEKVCTAGVQDGVMTVVINHTRVGSWLHVGGLGDTVGGHADWSNRQIAVGDEITVRVVDAETVDPPTEVRPRDDSDRPAKEGRKP